MCNLAFFTFVLLCSIKAKAEFSTLAAYIPISFVVIYGRICYSPFAVGDRASQKTELRNNKNAKLLNLEMTLETIKLLLLLDLN